MPNTDELVPWTPAPDYNDTTGAQDKPATPEGAILQALGSASTCWESMDETGVFDSDRAKAIGEGLVAHLKAHPLDPKPNLGMATTAQLLDELRARIEMDWYAGGGGLGYTAVDGRPSNADTTPVDPAHPDWCPRDHGCSLPAGHDGDCSLTAALCFCPDCQREVTG